MPTVSWFDERRMSISMLWCGGARPIGLFCLCHVLNIGGTRGAQGADLPCILQDACSTRRRAIGAPRPRVRLIRPNKGGRVTSYGCGLPSPIATTIWCGRSDAITGPRSEFQMTLPSILGMGTELSAKLLMI